MQQLVLTAKEIAVSGGTLRWHWRLQASGGRYLADSPVKLDAGSWEYQAFTDLYGWLGRHPGRDAAQALAALGDWLTSAVLGDVARALAAARPCAVRLWQESPAPLDVIGLPFELATVDGKPLAVQDVSFVVAPDGPPAAAPPAAPGPLRVLGLFSLPDGAQSMNLRRERRALEALASSLAGRDMSLTTLQYGTTRQALRRALEEGAGWDVVHLSGHGQAGTFVLEKPDGTPDRVSGAGLIELLGPLRDRVRLVTVSACESAERAGRRDLALLPLGITAGELAGGEQADGEAAAAAVGSGLGLQLARHLNCAVLGMRYPVAESFAAAFTQELYRLMLEMGRPLPQARAWAAARAAGGQATPECPPLSLITPAVYGARGLELTLRAPDRDGPPSFGYKSTKLAGIPGRPASFAGRSGPMTRVSQALASGSGQAAVVIEGMDRIGKTALALETVYGQAGNFQVIAWHDCQPGSAQAGPGGSAADGLAGVLSAKIPGLDVSPLRGSDAQARGFAAGVAAYFAGVRALIVLDGADAQLTDAGHWRDERLALLVRALAGEAGQTRLVITSRRPLADVSRWAAAPVIVRLAPLRGAEAALLASEFPGLKALRDGDGRSLRPPLSSASAQGLAAGVLAATRGHPALLAIAAGHASDPLVLGRMAIQARQIWAGDAASGDAEAAYRQILSAWRPGSAPG